MTETVLLLVGVVLQAADMILKVLALIRKKKDEQSRNHPH